ncbi:Amino acid adenylation domain protein OS=Tsukamurella paurometabola (strain ATCC 8368 / DSM/ CCUG 35730 / CIP 100753 / JCM 10117 / KCTC 9821 / NBRC 16120/ NCIMB 702349 / NCTC 13040) OX=521096 GN=Tpau_4319 PE=4 SV=1 [Tsukamurella paurometabola]|uniref:Amino acid adenylation domain protein n=1 Tax=Tsukamurella paurometabola (strain ATCC 8368 / DSM 20162 / CCUG 35730 / CIP 100753 / JCM 10117 / KCTC 9821 / NBRC 16120 / NCIMB 702349 / NCTC 13040) TaxID=521096 RepID=D5UZ33_TSUPD|nr:non-ribosomal peptide synthetase [Tsukamurella paurometabola]ADG80880.1 amino acid adenylation domain protein [Tsukamurella paurometabola DSM 20162]SUQ39246.1 Surfactin synthase subunit 3 [Tsukamurella paurometabola]
MSGSTSDAPRIEDVLALTPLQAGLHALAALTDGVDVYTMQFVIDLDGADPARLRSAAQAVLDRHPHLRASIWDRDVPRPVQVVPDRAVLPWFERRVAADELDAFLRADADAPFDLADGPLLRATHVLVDDGGARLVFTAHHILLDGWSMALFFRELLALYDGIPLPPAPLFRDYVAWLAAQSPEVGLAAWAEHLDGTSPTTLGSGPVRPGTVSGSVTCTLSAADTATVLDWGRANGLTPAAVTATAWATVLGRLTDRDDVVFGTVVAGRPEVLPGVESMVGLFINTVPQRVRIDPNAAPAAACAALQAEAARMRSVGHVPLADIARQSGGPLFDTLFVFENAPLGDATATVRTSDGAAFRPVTMRSLAHYPLSVVALIDPSDGAPRLTVVIEAVDGLDAVPRPAELGERLLQVLRALPTTGTVGALPVERPGDLVPPSASTAGVERSVAGGFTPLPRLFADLVASMPDAPALSTAETVLSYGELGGRVASAAVALSAAGIGRGDRVGLLADRDERAVIAILAALTVGAAYVPLAPDLPDDRIAAMFERAAVRAVVATTEHAQRTAGALPVVVPPETAGAGTPRPVDLGPDDDAYVIFTSGSTGEPKGVLGTHGALAAYRADHVHRMYRPAQERLGRPLRVAHGWSLSFDASWQPLLALFAGHHLRLLSDAEIRDAQAMIAVLGDEGIDMIDTSPSLFGQLAEAGLVDGDERLHVLALGGEAIPPHLWDRLAALPETDVYNCYGPTETTVEAVVGAVTPGAPRIGEPTAGTRAYVLDRRLRSVPAGAVGELYLGGPQLTRGYVGRPDLTAARFVADPFAGGGARMYRTGDLVRLDARGRIVFLGRADDQVKVRGYRIELGEVESALTSAPGVRGAGVVVMRRGGSATLVGFVAGSADAPSVRAAAARLLPGYMVPARIDVLDRLPLTRNGKVDGAALTARAEALLAAAEAGVPPSTPTEHAVAAVWEEIWPGAGTDVHADLFDLGLDSILAIAAVGRLRRAGLPVSPATLMANPTIATLAAALDAQEAPSDVDSGAVDLTPLPLVRRTLLGGGYARYAQAGLFAVPAGVALDEVGRVLDAVLAVHPALRARLSGGRLLADGPPVSAAGLLAELGTDPAAIAGTVRSLDADAGRMLAAGVLRRPDHDHDLLVVAIHHLLADGVSWQILCEDIAETALGGAPLTEVSTAAQYASRLADDGPACVDTRLSPADVAAAAQTLGFELAATASARLTGRDVEAVLADAVRRACALLPDGAPALALTRHGRDDARHGTDTSRTVGWFTTHVPAGPDEGGARWAAVNYLGRRDLAPSGPWLPVLDPGLTALIPAQPEPALPLLFPLEVLAVFRPGAGGPVLSVQVRFLPRLISPADAGAVLDALHTILSAAERAPDARKTEE